MVDPKSSVASLCSRPAVEATSDLSIADAVLRMRDEGVSSLLLDDGRAIVTERDVARAVAFGCDVTDPVGVAASPHPVTVPGAVTVVAAAGLMLNEHVRHLVVELPGGGRSVISLRDVVAVLLSVVDRDLWLTSLRVTIGGPAEIFLG